MVRLVSLKPPPPPPLPPVTSNTSNLSATRVNTWPPEKHPRTAAAWNTKVLAFEILSSLTVWSFIFPRRNLFAPHCLVTYFSPVETSSPLTVWSLIFPVETSSPLTVWSLIFPPSKSLRPGLSGHLFFPSKPLRPSLSGHLFSRRNLFAPIVIYFSPSKSLSPRIVTYFPRRTLFAPDCPVTYFFPFKISSPLTVSSLIFPRRDLFAPHCLITYFPRQNLFAPHCLVTYFPRRDLFALTV